MCAASGAACQGRAFIAALSPQRRGLQPHLGTGNVNMPTRGKAGGSGQEAKAKSCSAFAVKQLPGLSNVLEQACQLIWANLGEAAGTVLTPDSWWDSWRWFP